MKGRIKRAVGRSPPKTPDKMQDVRAKDDQKEPLFEKQRDVPPPLRESRWAFTEPRLREVNKEDQIAELISKMRVPGDEGCNASKELVQIGKPAVPLLIVALRDPDYKVQVRAAKALGEIGDNMAVPALLEAIGGRHPNLSMNRTELLVWESAALALRKIVNGK